MPLTDNSGTISPEQYQDYKAAWAKLIASANPDALTKAFQLPGVERLNFLTFSIDQILALVSADGAQTIKARFLLMPDAPARPRFSAALFATDAGNTCVSDYYVPAQAPAVAAATGAAAQTPADSTKLPREETLRWLTEWVSAPALLPALFTTSQEPMHGYNFKLSTFTDPLAVAPPYENKVLFLNLGLEALPDALVTTQFCNLVVYINLLSGRKQGSVEGLPDDDSFYDHGSLCPPAPFI